MILARLCPPRRPPHRPERDRAGSSSAPARRARAAAQARVQASRRQRRGEVAEHRPGPPRLLGLRGRRRGPHRPPARPPPRPSVDDELLAPRDAGRARSASAPGCAAGPSTPTPPPGSSATSPPSSDRLEQRPPPRRDHERHDRGRPRPDRARPSSSEGHPPQRLRPRQRRARAARARRLRRSPATCSRSARPRSTSRLYVPLFAGAAERDGRLHAFPLTLATVTGRMCLPDVPLQTRPKGELELAAENGTLTAAIRSALVTDETSSPPASTSPPWSSGSRPRSPRTHASAPSSSRATPTPPSPARLFDDQHADRETARGRENRQLRRPLRDGRRRPRPPAADRRRTGDARSSPAGGTRSPPSASSASGSPARSDAPSGGAGSPTTASPTTSPSTT